MAGSEVKRQPVTGQALGKQLCELLGIDMTARRVTRLVVDAGVGEVATVTVTELVLMPVGAPLAIEQRYDLAALDEPAKVVPLDPAPPDDDVDDGPAAS